MQQIYNSRYQRTGWKPWAQYCDSKWKHTFTLKKKFFSYFSLIANVQEFGFDLFGWGKDFCLWSIEHAEPAILGVSFLT